MITDDPSTRYERHRANIHSTGAILRHLSTAADLLAGIRHHMDRRDLLFAVATTGEQERIRAILDRAAVDIRNLERVALVIRATAGCRAALISGQPPEPPAKLRVVAAGEQPIGYATDAVDLGDLLADYLERRVRDTAAALTLAAEGFSRIRRRDLEAALPDAGPHDIRDAETILRRIQDSLKELEDMGAAIRITSDLFCGDPGKADCAIPGEEWENEEEEGEE